MSSGKFSLNMLRSFGHPYSKKRPNNAFDPAILNVQSGELKAGWDIQKDDDELELVVDNTSESYQFIQAGGSGSSRMRTRPIERYLRGVALRLWPIYLDKELAKLEGMQ